MVIELSVLKSDERAVQVWFQTTIARREVQLPLYYSHFEIVEFSQYENFIDWVAGLLKRLLHQPSHFVFETDTMRELKGCGLERKWCDLEQMRFRTKNDVIRE